jgi:cell division protein FtsX
MTDDDLTRTTSSIDTRLTRLTWTVNLWGAAITILLAIILVLSGTPIRGHGP